MEKIEETITFDRQYQLRDLGVKEDDIAKFKTNAAADATIKYLEEKKKPALTPKEKKAAKAAKKKK